MGTAKLVLRTVYISPQLDEELRSRAFAGRTSKNDLIRRYIELGMKAAARIEPAPAAATRKPAPAEKVPAAKKATPASRSAPAKNATAAAKSSARRKTAVR